MKLLALLKRLSEDVNNDNAVRLARAEAMGFDTSTVYYHGTTADFDAFSKDGVKRNFGSAQADFGHYFTRRPREAGNYSGHLSTYDVQPGNSNIIPVFLRGKFKTGDTVWISPWWEKDGSGSFGTDHDAQDVMEYKKQLISQGYDGVIFKNVDGHDYEWVVFDPKNIRSIHAQFNDADSDNLMASIGEDVNTDKAARQARAKSMGFDPDKVWYHANTGGIEGEGFDNDRLPYTDPDTPFNAHWFGHRPSEFAAWSDGKVGNTITPVHLALRKEAKRNVWRKVTGQVFKELEVFDDNEENNFDAPFGDNSPADEIRERLVKMGYTHVVRGRDPVDSDELARTGETKFKNSSGVGQTLRWGKVWTHAPEPVYTDEEQQIMDRNWDARNAFRKYELKVHKSLAALMDADEDMNKETFRKLLDEKDAIQAEIDRLYPLVQKASARARAVAQKQQKQVDFLELLDDEIGHVTGYDDLADYESFNPELDNIAVLDPSIIRSVHAGFNPDEAGTNKIMSGIGMTEALGPHQNRELELMLAGKKRLAMIDMDLRSEMEQHAWHQALADGKVILTKGNTGPGQPTSFFTLPGEEWRVPKAQEIYDMVERTGVMTLKNHTDFGRLLGYSDADINHFLTHAGITESVERKLYEVERKSPSVAYHATFPDNRDNIRLHGLDPKYSDTFEEGAVFFATGATPDPTMDIWKADLRGLDMEYDNDQVTGEQGWGDNEHWWYTHEHVVPDRLKLVQKGTG